MPLGERAGRFGVSWDWDEYAALRRENAAQRETIAELQRRLSKDSSNSSKPPRATD